MGLFFDSIRNAEENSHISRQKFLGVNTQKARHSVCGNQQQNVVDKLQRIEDVSSADVANTRLK